MSVPHPVEKYIGDVNSFVEPILSALASKYEIDITNKIIDHICYRCESKLEYKSLIKNIIDDKLGEILIESMIGDRPISIIKLYAPLRICNYDIYCIEIPCPKQNGKHMLGLEHLEIVIGSSVDTPINNKDALITFMNRYPTVTFDKKAIDKYINADVCLNIGNGSNAKFHLLPIEEVVKFEKQCDSFLQVPSNYFDDVQK